MFASVANTANYNAFFKLCSTKKRYWKISLALDFLFAIFLKSTLLLSKKLSPWIYNEAVESLRILPFDVAGTPFLVIILPVLSMLLPARLPALEATLVPILWNPVFILPVFIGLIIGFELVPDLNEVPTLASLFV